MTTAARAEAVWVPVAWVEVDPDARTAIPTGFVVTVVFGETDAVELGANTTSAQKLSLIHI